MDLLQEPRHVPQLHKLARVPQAEQAKVVEVLQVPGGPQTVAQAVRSLRRRAKADALAAATALIPPLTADAGEVSGGDCVQPQAFEAFGGMLVHGAPRASLLRP